MMPMNFSDTAILNIKGSDYRCIISLISENEAIKLIQNADLTKKSATLENIKNLFSYRKMGKEILAFGDTEIEKSKFYGNKTSTFLRDVDIKKVLGSNKISFGEKGYKRLTFFFFYQGFLSRTLTAHRTAEEGRGPSFSTLPLPPAHEHSDIYLQLCT